MINVLILFGVPVEPEAFDQYFETGYRSLLYSVPNVERLAVNRIAGAAEGDPPFYCIVELEFGSEERMQEGLNSEAGQAMARDLSQFASGGVTVLFARATVELLGAEASP